MSADPTLSQVLEEALSRIDTVIQLRVAATTAAAGDGAGEGVGAAGGEAGAGEGNAGSAAEGVGVAVGNEDVIMADVEIMQRMDALLSDGMGSESSPSSDGGARNLAPVGAGSGAGSGGAGTGDGGGGLEGAPSGASAAAAAAAAAASGERGSRDGAAATEEGSTNSMRAMIAQHRSAADRLRRTIELRIRRENSAGSPPPTSPTSVQHQARAKAEAERR